MSAPDLARARSAHSFFGRSRGVVEGILGACGVTASLITPAAWKRTVGLSVASKDAARSEAIRRWPNHAALFARTKDDGRAEASLIGVAGLIRKDGR
jgi:crossover junction endodeoxyribonuclease RuvC